MAESPPAGEHPFVAAFRRHAEQVLRPAAVRTDRTGVTAETIAGLAAIGGLNHLAPQSHGGAALGRDDDRRTHEILAGACSGQGVTGDDTAALHARSALFVLVQGQNGAVRDAQLRHFHALATTADRTAP